MLGEKNEALPSIWRADRCTFTDLFLAPHENFVASAFAGMVLLGITIRDELIKKPVMLAAIAGVFAAVLRLIMMLYSGNNADVISVILDSLVIYILYAALYQFLSGVMGEDYLPDMLFTMLMADLISNLVSLAICNKMSDERAAWLLVIGGDSFCARTCDLTEKSRGAVRKAYKFCGQHLCRHLFPAKVKKAAG